MAACALSSAVAYVVKVDGRKAWCILFDPLDTKVNACTYNDSKNKKNKVEWKGISS